VVTAERDDMMGRVSRIRQPKNTSAPVRSIGATAVALMLVSGCSGVSPGEAAIIEGEVIGVRELQETTEQLNTVSQQPSTPSSVLSELSRMPFFDRAAAGTPGELTEQQVIDVLQASGLEDPTDLTIDVARTRQYGVTIEEPDMTDALAELNTLTVEDFEALDIEVSDRYGSFDPNLLEVTPTTPEWITPAG